MVTLSGQAMHRASRKPNPPLTLRWPSARAQGTQSDPAVQWSLGTGASYGTRNWAVTRASQRYPYTAGASNRAVATHAGYAAEGGTWRSAGSTCRAFVNCPMRFVR